MNRPLALVTVLSLALVGVACTGGGAGPSGAARPAAAAEAVIGTPVATVNGLPVGTQALDDAARGKDPAAGGAYSAEERKELLDQAIENELLFQEAFARGLYNDPKVKKILISLLLKPEVYEKVGKQEFTDEQIAAYFEEHKDAYVIPEKVQVRAIEVASTPELDAAAAEARAKEAGAKAAATPDAFREVAIEFSNGVNARRGGEYGYVGRDGQSGTIPPEVVERAFALDVGAVSEPFLVGSTWWILQVPNKRERVERTLEQVRAAVVRHLKQKAYEEMIDTMVADLRTKAQVTVDDASLGAWTPKVEDERPPGGAPGMLPPGLPPGAAPDRNDLIRVQQEQDEAAGGAGN